MKPILIALVAILPLVAAPAAADHPEACAEVTDLTLDTLNDNVLHPAARLASQRHCIEAIDGETVHWTNLDVVPHALADVDDGQCFRGARGDENTLAPGESLAIAFDHQPDADVLHVRMWDADGEPVVFLDPHTGAPTDVNVCSHAHLRLADDRIVLPWRSTSAPTVHGDVYLSV